MFLFHSCKIFHQNWSLNEKDVGSSLGFMNYGCRFSYAFQIEANTKRQFCTKSKGRKSDFLKICGCSCTNSTHGNHDPDREPRVSRCTRK